MAETNEELAAEIRGLAKEGSAINDKIDRLLAQILDNCPVDIRQEVIITDHKGRTRHAFIARIQALRSGKYSIKFNKAKKDGTCSMISDYVYSDQKVTRVSDGFDVNSIMS